MPAKTSVVIIIAAVSAVGIAAIATYVRAEPRAVIPAPVIQHSYPVVNPPVQPAQTPKNPYVLVFQPHMGMDGISFTNLPESPPDGTDPKMFAVNEFLKVSKVPPVDAKVIGIDLQNKVAILGFNKAFKHTYGTFDEKTLLDGLAITLGQFKDIDKYTIEVDGQPLDTLGSVSLSDPIPVIRPNLSDNKPSWGTDADPNSASEVPPAGSNSASSAGDTQGP